MPLKLIRVRLMIYKLTQLPLPYQALNQAEPPFE